MDSSSQAREETYYQQLEELLAAAKSRASLYKAIVNAPFHDPLSATYLDLGVVVLLMVSDDGKSINRIALSETEHAANAVKTSEKPFKEIVIPLSYEKNIIARAIKTGEMQRTEDWKDLFVPALTPESARFNQAGAGIACSIVQPLNIEPYGGAMIFSLFQHSEDFETAANFTKLYADLVSKKLSNHT